MKITMTALFSPLCRLGGWVQFHLGGKKRCLAAESSFSGAKSCSFWETRRMGMIYFLFIVGVAQTFTQFQGDGNGKTLGSSAYKHRIYSWASRFKAGLSIINYNNRRKFNGGACKNTGNQNIHADPHTHYGLRLMQRACLLNAHRKWWDI